MVPVMARLPLVDPDDPNLDPAVRDRLRRSYGTGKRVPNVLRAMANHPLALQVGAGVSYRPESRLTPAQRELAYLTASVVNRCHY
jgi:alkylhydroperoxidase family enzyme